MMPSSATTARLMYQRWTHRYMEALARLFSVASGSRTTPATTVTAKLTVTAAATTINGTSSAAAGMVWTIVRSTPRNRSRATAASPVGAARRKPRLYPPR